jgi:hypothetical protein
MGANLSVTDTKMQEEIWRAPDLMERYSDSLDNCRPMVACRRRRVGLPMRLRILVSASATVRAL